MKKYQEKLISLPKQDVNIGRKKMKITFSCLMTEKKPTCRKIHFALSAQWIQGKIGNNGPFCKLAGGTIKIIYLQLVLLLCWGAQVRLAPHCLPHTLLWLCGRH